MVKRGKIQSPRQLAILGISFAIVVWVTAATSVTVFGWQESTQPTPTADDADHPAVTQPDESAVGAGIPGGETSNAKTEHGLIRLHKEDEVWIDPVRKQVIVGGRICLRQGQLEMFACPAGTKEHESVVAVNAKAYVVHAGLLAIGARAGQPVRYEPVYQPARGDLIKVEVIWRGDDGQPVRRLAQQMVRNVRTHMPMQHQWVFAGSRMWKDETTGQEYYQAEGGDLICVSNFSTATLDLPVESPRDNAGLLYEALTDHIPPRGTVVRLVLSSQPNG